MLPELKTSEIHWNGLRDISLKKAKGTGKGIALISIKLFLFFE